MRKKHFDPLVQFFLLVALLVSVFLISGLSHHPERDTASTYSKNRGGMKGLYLVLEKLEKDTRRWKRPFPLLEHEEIGTLVVTDPKKPLSPKEEEALDSWFSKGGQMILLHDGDWEIKASGYDDEIYSFMEFFDGHPQLFVIKDRLKLTNDGLKNNPENGVEIIQRIFSHSGPVYFDEYHLYNSEKAIPWALIKQYSHHPFGWVTLHLIALFFLYLLSVPKSEEIEENNNKIKKVNLIKARASFLAFARAKEFGKQVILKYRRNKHDAYS